MQIVDESVFADPSTWIEQSDFVRQTLAGELLGVTSDGHGVYVQEATAELWQRDETWESTTSYVVTRVVPEGEVHPEFDTAFCPPKEETLEEASITLDGGTDELATYILESSDNQGPWKMLTSFGWKILAHSELRVTGNIGSPNSDSTQRQVSEVTTDD